jgi:hypothetical protein
MRAAVARALRVTSDHLSNRNLCTTPNLGKALLVQYILDDAKLRPTNDSQGAS